jgi:hypothetical protein
MKKLIILATLALAAVGAGGCIVETHPHHHRVYGPAVVIAPAHIHSEACGHFYYGGHWYLSSGHVHTVGCGHVWRGGMWVVVD